MLVPICWLDKIKQTCNKAFPPNKATVSPATKVHCHYLPDNTTSDTHTKSIHQYSNEVIHPLWLCEKLWMLHFSAALLGFYWSTIGFHEMMMKYLWWISSISHAKSGFCLSAATFRHISHYLSLSFLWEMRLQNRFCSCLSEAGVSLLLFLFASYSRGIIPYFKLNNFYKSQEHLVVLLM